MRNLKRLDEILLNNDGTYDPLSDISTLSSKPESFKADFWSLTLSHQHQSHIQSVFFAFRKSLIQNSIFKKFRDTLELQDNIDEFLYRHEVEMMRFVKIIMPSAPIIFDQKTLRFLEKSASFRVNGRRIGRMLIGTIRRHKKIELQTLPAPIGIR